MKFSREAEIRLQELVSAYKKLKIRNRDLEKLLVDQTARTGELEKRIRDLKKQFAAESQLKRKDLDGERRKLGELIDAALVRLDKMEEDL